MQTTKIMLVDEDVEALDALECLLARHLRTEGGAVFGKFNSPCQALAAAGECRYELAIAGFRLPEMDGVQLLGRLHAEHPEMGGMLVCGARDFDFVLRAIDFVRVARVVLKPWLEAELVSAVRQALVHGRIRAENRLLADEVRAQRGLAARQEAELRRLEERWPGITRSSHADFPRPAL